MNKLSVLFAMILAGLMAVRGDEVEFSRLGSPRELGCRTYPVMIDGRKNEMFTRRMSYDGGLDIMQLNLAHLGGRRFLWRLGFCKRPNVSGGKIRLSLDTDEDTKTGWKGATGDSRNGSDLEVEIDARKSVVREWAPDGKADAVRGLDYAVRDNAVYFVLEMPVAAGAKTMSFGVSAQAENIPADANTKPAMVDATRKVLFHRFRLNTESVDDRKDTDGDGLTDAVEHDFGSEPAKADTFTELGASPLMSGRQLTSRKKYEKGMDITGVSVRSVAEDRYIFKVTFGEKPPVERMVCIVYVDCDNEQKTGRDTKGFIMGTDVMLSSSAGKGWLGVHGLKASQCGDGKVRLTTVDNALYFCADIPLKVSNGKTDAVVSVLSHTANEKAPGMQDALERVPMQIAVTPGKKPERADGATWKVTGGTEHTYGLNFIRPAYWAKDTVRVDYDRLDLSGFDIDYFTTLEYGNVKPLYAGASAACRAPTGKYYLGFMTFERRDFGAELGIAVDGVELGSARLNCANNNFQLYWLTKPVIFQGGELAELVSLRETQGLPLCCMLFMKTPPTPRKQACGVDNLEYRLVPEAPGTVLLSWLSDNLTTTRLEYGAGNFAQVFEKPTNTQLHRARLTGLVPSVEYQARGVGKDLEGKPVYSNVIRFKPVAPRPETQAANNSVPLYIDNPGAALTQWCVTGGIPFPQGVLGDVAHIVLLKDGKRMDADIDATAYWPDYSVKWVLVSLVDDFAAGARNNYTLEYGRGVSVKEASVIRMASAMPDGGVKVNTHAAEFVVTPRGELMMNGRPVRTHVRLSNGRVLETGSVPAKVTITANGSCLTKIRAESVFTLEDGTPLFTVISRFAFGRESRLVRLSHGVLAQGKEGMLDFEECVLELPFGTDGWTAERKDADALTLKAGDRIYQREFDHCLENGGEPVKERLTGTFTRPGELAVVRHFWEQSPKGISLGKDGVRLELFPDFNEGYFDSFPFNVMSTKHYFHLRGGHYKFRRGMRKTHELLLGASANGAEAAAFQRPLLLVSPPAWNCESKAFYSVAVKNPERFEGYETNVDRNLAAYRTIREQHKDYGVLSFGDWFGERGVHWGNSEYDNTAAFLLEYIRSGNPEAFHLASESEAQNNDVNIEHWVPQGIPGKVYIHQVGHTGGYYKESPKGADAWNHGGGTATHSWAEGHFWYYFLTGDENALEAGLSTVDYHTATGHSFYYHLAGELRNPAWRLIMNAAAYAATYDPAYLNSSRIIMRVVYEYQDKIPRPVPDYQLKDDPHRKPVQVGGWSRMLVPGHCHCIPRHRGNANFMVALLLTGIKQYYEITGEEAAKQALIAGAYYLLDECYSPIGPGLRYTSCPKMKYNTWCVMYMVEGIARAYLWTHDERLAHPLKRLLPLSERGTPYGQASYYRGGPRVLADMEAAGLKWEKPVVPAGRSAGTFKKPDWLAKAVIIQGEDYKRQGGGECRIIEPRLGAWGKLISYWEANLGHWIEWEANVPADGNYAIRFHYASGSDNAYRDFMLDGKLACPEAAKIVLPGTGGFGFSPLNWAYASLKGRDGKEIALKLTKGKHVIRMKNLGGGLAFDFMALVKQ